jgi:hypothetical protein
MNPSREFSLAAIDRNMFDGAVRGGVLSLAMLLVTACGGGASTETNPVTGTTGTVTTSSYNGPNAQTEDIREFQVNVWESLRVSTKCGACHGMEVGQAPLFVREDDVNLAYAAVTPLVNLEAPSSSRLVSKVGGGHNCWLPSDAACAQSVTSLIEAWARGVSGGAREIQLTAPDAYAPGATRSFPADSSVFMTSSLWTTLKDNCQACHSENATNAQSPFFASDDVDTAWDAVKSKIDLNDDVNDPERSRLIVRLRSEFHNCWTSSCTDDAQDMEDDVLGLIAAIDATNPITGIDPDLVISNAVNIVNDGVVASGGNRHEANVIALYEFKTGAGNIALDSSGVAPELNLTLDRVEPGYVEWVGGWGIRFVDGKAQGFTTASKKLHDLIKATGEYSIEAWVAPANVTQEGPARIVTYSGGTDVRNFTLGQTQYNYDFLQRSSTTDANGEPALSTDDADEDLQATLQHVVVNFDPINGRSIYVNGEFTDDMDPAPVGNLNDWDDSFALVLGNEVSGDRQFQGTIRMLAIHNRVLTPEQIQQNLEVGVGQKFFMLFGIGHVDGVPEDSYIMFEVEQYDSYSYLFNKATFINLDGTVVPSDIRLEGMRIGLNGKEVAVGQAYSNLALTIGSNYDPATGESLSDLGTVIALENGQDSDEFFLTFERLGDASNDFVEVSPTPPPPLPTPPVTADIGVRTFDEINAAMAALTGVDEQLVKPQFDVLRQQLPAVETLEGFLSAHQMGIAQLAIAYCDNLVEDAGARSTFFARGFNFDMNVYDAFASNKQVDVIDDLYDRMIGIPRSGVDLSQMPTRAEVQLELNNPVDGPDLDVTLDPPLPATPDGLYDRLRFTDCSGSKPATVPPACNDVRTRAIVKALCASTLSSAAMLVQ